MAVLFQLVLSLSISVSLGELYEYINLRCGESQQLWNHSSWLHSAELRVVSQRSRGIKAPMNHSSTLIHSNLCSVHLKSFFWKRAIVCISLAQTVAGFGMLWCRLDRSSSLFLTHFLSSNCISINNTQWGIACEWEMHDCLVTPHPGSILQLSMFMSQMNYILCFSNRCHWLLDLFIHLKLQQQGEETNLQTVTQHIINSF